MHNKVTFSRIPIYENEPNNIIEYVFCSDLLLAQARGNGCQELKNYGHELKSVLNTFTLGETLNELLWLRVHMMLVVYEYGDVNGIVTLEDILETMLGLGIVDEKDKTVNMRKEARKIQAKKIKT